MATCNTLSVHDDDDDDDNDDNGDDDNNNNNNNNNNITTFEKPTVHITWMCTFFHILLYSCLIL
jgi:hypothetical protein